jgi:hypothetical protein
MVYWIRRGAIVLVVITLLVALWWLVGSLRGGGASSSTSTSSSASASAGGSPAASSPPTGDATASAGASTAILDCVDSAITVDATTDSSTYKVGATPKLTLTITNSGTVACTRDVGPKANSLEITSGGYHVWSSDDCQPNSKSKVTTLQPGQTYAASITWDGKLSQKGKCGGAAAKPGRYGVIGHNGKVTSSTTPFALTA